MEKGLLKKVRNYLSIITIIFLIFCGIIAVAGGAAGYWIVSLLNIPAHLFFLCYMDILHHPLYLSL